MKDSDIGVSKQEFLERMWLIKGELLFAAALVTVPPVLCFGLAAMTATGQLASSVSQDPVTNLGLGAVFAATGLGSIPLMGVLAKGILDGGRERVIEFNRAHPFKGLAPR